MRQSVAIETTEICVSCISPRPTPWSAVARAGPAWCLPEVCWRLSGGCAVHQMEVYRRKRGPESCRRECLLNLDHGHNRQLCFALQSQGPRGALQRHGRNSATLARSPFPFACRTRARETNQRAWQWRTRHGIPKTGRYARDMVAFQICVDRASWPSHLQHSTSTYYVVFTASYPPNALAGMLEHEPLPLLRPLLGDYAAGAAPGPSEPSRHRASPRNTGASA